jgi:hypothetical protein
MAINGTLVLKDTNGRLLTTQVDGDIPAGFNGGTPVVPDRRLTITSVTSNLWKLGGLSYDDAGRLAVTTVGPIKDWSAGIPLDNRGRVFMEDAGVYFYNSNGVPITYSGAVAMGISFAPGDMFLDGEEGVWYDPSDLDTMFQDSAGTVPVTAPGQPVGRILDKSGNGHHAIAPAANNRPTLRLDEKSLYYLDFDGVDDGMETVGSVDFSATDKVTLWTGLQKSTALSH